MVAFGVWGSQELERLAREGRGFVCDFRLLTTDPISAPSAIFAYADFVLERICSKAFNDIAELQHQISSSEVRSVEDLTARISILLR
jgi:hypothetical protein